METFNTEAASLPYSPNIIFSNKKKKSMSYREICTQTRGLCIQIAVIPVQPCQFLLSTVHLVGWTFKSLPKAPMSAPARFSCAFVSSEWQRQRQCLQLELENRNIKRGM